MYADVCFIHRFLVVFQLQSERSPFSLLDGWKTMYISSFSQIQFARALSTAQSLVNLTD